MSSDNVSDEEILRLWKSPLFSGSFFGCKKFALLLKTDLNITVPESRILRVLSQDPLFITHQRKRQKIQHRHFFLSSVGECVQGDLAFMFSRNEYHYIVVCVDIFSGKIFTRPIKDKYSATVAKALKSIFNEFKTQIQKFETDRGTEFKGPSCRKLYKEKKIYFKQKNPPNKGL